MADGSSPPDGGTFCLQPAKIEAALHDRAHALLDRFGLADLRISGTPSLEQCSATLDTLEFSLAEIARGAGIPEKAIGLGNRQCIHINADVGRASGYSSGPEPHGIGTICLSPDNGWRTLAHEWFHAFDAAVPMHSRNDSVSSMATAEAIDAQGKLAKKTKGLAPASSMSDSDWTSDRLLRYAGRLDATRSKASLLRAAHAVISGLRSSPGRDALADIANEETQASVARIREGLYERFYKNRVSAGLEAQAEQRFTSLCLDMLSGKAHLADVAAWRKEHLGNKAEMCKHYDAFVVAEREARDSRVAAKMDGSGAISTMQRFAKLADEQLAQASGENYWDGYSSSAVEMSARGFEGNCFLDTPDSMRAHLVDGRDNSMYWPAGAERGAHRDKYRAYFAHGVMSMIGTGQLKPDILSGFDPAPKSSPPPLPHDANVGSKLASRRAQQTNETPAPQAATSKRQI